MSTSTSNIWIDANGFTRLTTFNNSGSPGGGIIQSDIGAVSRAGLQRYWEGVNHIPSGAGSVGVYQSVQDAAVLIFETAAGSIVKLVVPAPLLSIFGADQQTVDPAMITTLIADALLYLTDVGGNLVVAYQGGFYQRSGKVLVGG